MADELILVPEEVEIVTCNTHDGKKIDVNIFDIDQMMIDVSEEGMTLSQQAQKMIDKFDEKYNYRMNRTSMVSLMILSTEKIKSLKKNILAESERLGSTESPQEPTES